jgi:hypothetical protein
MRTNLALSLLSVCLLAGGVAASAQRLYPVSGPSATQGPPPVFTAKLSGGKEFTGKVGSTGKIVLSQANGEQFHGTWTVYTASFANKKTPGAPDSYAPQPNLAFAWDMVYGPGFYVANILGSEHVGQAVTTGSQGTVLQIEFRGEAMKAREGNTFGVAIDSRGNIYKVVI